MKISVLAMVLTLAAVAVWSVLDVLGDPPYPIRPDLQEMAQ